MRTRFPSLILLLIVCGCGSPVESGWRPHLIGIAFERNGMGVATPVGFAAETAAAVGVEPGDRLAIAELEYRLMTTDEFASGVVRVGMRERTPVPRRLPQLDVRTTATIERIDRRGRRCLDAKRSITTAWTRSTARETHATAAAEWLVERNWTAVHLVTEVRVDGREEAVKWYRVYPVRLVPTSHLGLLRANLRDNAFNAVVDRVENGAATPSCAD